MDAGSRLSRRPHRQLSPSTNFEVDIDAELAQFGTTGYRPLRMCDTQLPRSEVTGLVDAFLLSIGG